MESEWKTYRLGDISKLRYGKLPPIDTKEGQYPIFSGYRIVGYTSSYNCSSNTPIVVARGVGGTGDVKLLKQNCYLTNLAISVDIDENICTAKYFYYMHLLHNLKWLDSGAAQSQITIDDLSRLKLSLPPISKQNRITSILSSYDDLIENNNRRIKILEQMAENLYKEWFIRFRFPGYESSSFVASSIGRIPEGFSVLKMQDVIDYHIGGGWGSDVRDKNFECEAFVIRGTDFPYVKEGILSTCPRRYHKINNYRTRKLEEGDIILEVSGGTAEQPVGRALLVTKDTLRRFGRKLICASFCKLVRLKRNIISPYYFIYWMNFLYSTRIIEKFQLQSTGIINFKFEYFFKKGDILLPPVDLMHIFVGKIKTIKAQIDKLAEVNENLTKQRDKLLPRLMSGKLEV